MEKKYWLFAFFILANNFFSNFAWSTISGAAIGECEARLLEVPATTKQNSLNVLRPLLYVKYQTITDTGEPIFAFGGNIHDLVTIAKEKTTVERIASPSGNKRELAFWVLALIPDILRLHAEEAQNPQSWLRDILPILLARCYDLLLGGRSEEREELIGIISRTLLNRYHDVIPGFAARMSFWDALHLAFTGEYAATSTPVARSIENMSKGFVGTRSLLAPIGGVNASKIIYNDHQMSDYLANYYHGVQGMLFGVDDQRVVAYFYPAYEGRDGGIPKSTTPDPVQYVRSYGVYGNVQIIFRRPMTLGDFIELTGLSIDPGSDMKQSRVTMTLPLTFSEVLQLSRYPQISVLRWQKITNFLWNP